MKACKLISILMCIVLLSSVLATAEEFDFVEEVADVAFEEQMMDEQEDFSAQPFESEYDQIEEVIEIDMETAEPTEEIFEKKSEFLPEQEAVDAMEDIVEDNASIPVYAVVTSNTYVYTSKSMAEMLGSFAVSQTVLLPECETDGDLTAVRFACEDVVYNGVIETADIVEYAFAADATTDGMIPIANGFVCETDIELQLTPDEWFEQNADQFFPAQMVYKEDMLTIGAMDLGMTSKYMVSGGIRPLYAYVETESSMMIMGQPTVFTFQIGGFDPKRIVYSIYSQEYTSQDEYYYADVYEATATGNQISFTPISEGRHFMTVYAYDAAGNYVYFDSNIYETAKASDAGNTSTVYGKAKSIVASVTNSAMGDYEKAKALHDWLVRNVSYAQNISNQASNPIYHAEGALLNGVAVCEGYAEAYRILLNEAGIKNTIVTSESGDHAWNLVMINGAWYHVDVVWDDPIGAAPDYVGYTYFALTDDQLRALSTGSHNWNESQTSTCMVPQSSQKSMENNYGGSEVVTVNSDPNMTRSTSMIPNVNNGVGEGAAASMTLPAQLELGVKQSYTLFPVYEPEDARTSVAYFSDNNGVATVTDAGVVTAKASGTAVITAQDAQGRTSNVVVVVRKAPKKVKVKKAQYTLNAGESFNIGASISNYTSPVIYYKSSSSSVATVDANGTVTAKKGGTATITATSYNGKKATCKVKVKAAPSYIKLSKNAVVLGRGSSYPLKAYLPKGIKAKYSWSVSGNAVSFNKGKIYAKEPGTATVTATTSNGKTASCTVTVVEAPTAVALNVSSVNMSKGKTYVISGNVLPDARASALTYKSSNSNVVTVNSAGKITAKKPGTAIITVSAYNKASAQCTVKVVKNKGVLQVVENTVNIDDYGVPMDGGEVMIADSEVPTAAAAQTGDEHIAWAVIMMMLSAAFLMAGIIAKKRIQR